MGRRTQTRYNRQRQTLALMRRAAVLQEYREIIEAATKAGGPMPRGVQRDIARKFGVSDKTVSIILSEARDNLPKLAETEALRVRASIVRRNDEARARLERLEHALLDQIEVSQRPAEQIHEAVEQADGRKIRRVISRRASRVGPDGKPIDIGDDMANPAFSAQLLQIESARLALDKEIRELLGVDAPTKSENVNVDLSVLSDDQLARLEQGEPLAAVLRGGNAA